MTQEPSSSVPEGGRPIMLRSGKLGLACALLALVIGLMVGLFHIGNEVWGSLIVGGLTAAGLLVLAWRLLRWQVSFNTQHFTYRGQSLRYADIQAARVRAVPTLFTRSMRHQIILTLPNGSRLRLDARCCAAPEPAELFIAHVKAYCPLAQLDAEDLAAELKRSRKVCLLPVLLGLALFLAVASACALYLNGLLGAAQLPN